MDMIVERGIGHRVKALSIFWLMIGMMFVGLVGVTSPAQALSVEFQSDAAIDGYIEAAGATFPPSASTAYPADSFGYVGQIKYVSSYVVYRGYISFDTSSLPDSASIISATLNIRGDFDASYSSDFDINVHSLSFGALDVTDWSLSDSFQGVLVNTASFVAGTWYSLSLDTSQISPTSTTQYVLKSNRDSTITPTGHEWVAFYLGASGSIPTLEIVYNVGGTTVSLELDSGSWLNGTAYPDIQEWNLTYELHCYEIDTVPNTKNVTVTKGNASWTLAGLTPSCNTTDTDAEILLDDVYDSICYRLWLFVPKSNPYTSIHLSLYNSFTGEGFFWEAMKVQICDGLTWDNTSAEDVARPDFDVEPNTNYTIRVLDYFDNMLVDYPFVSNAQDKYLSIPVPYYSWQIFNMNEAPVLMKIYWNNSGSPWEFFVGPQWIIERFLKGGNYTFEVTFYNTDGTAGDTVNYERTIPLSGLNASFIYVNGTTLSEIVTDIEGVMAVQTIITNLISPSVVLIYEDLPLAPVKIRSLSLSVPIVVDPYTILEATTYQNQTGLAGAETALWLPHPTTVGATYYNISDVLSFSGTYQSTIYINDTAGTNLYYNTVLPASLNMQSQNLTVWCNNSYSVSRASTWREVSEYSINYYPTQHKWETTLSLNNSMSFDYHSPYWYIAFPADCVIDQTTVTLYDLDNDVILSQRTNFDVTAGGVHVTLVQLNASNTRNFRLTFWDLNSTTGIGAPNLIAEAYTQSSLDGTPMKYTAVQWTNPWSVDYLGEVYITLNFSEGEDLLLSSITIVDETSGNVIPNSQWIYTGRTILILTDGVGTVSVGGARNYGIYFTLDTTIEQEKTDFFFGPIVLNGQQWFIGSYAVSWFLIVMILAWVVVAYMHWNQRPRAMDVTILTVCGTVIGFYLSSFMG